MTSEQKAAFVIANSIQALGELLAMHHANVIWQHQGHPKGTIPYVPQEFSIIADKRGLGWNDLMTFLEG